MVLSGIAESGNFVPQLSEGFMQYFISISIICICLVVIIWGLRIYKENRELEKQQQKYREDDDFRLYR